MRPLRKSRCLYNDLDCLWCNRMGGARDVPSVITVIHLIGAGYGS